MEKDRFFELQKQIRDGERVRVLFDMIMELINMQPDMQKVDFWLGIKAKIEGEQKGIAEMMKGGVVKKRKKVLKGGDTKGDIPVDEILESGDPYIEGGR